MTLTRLTIPVFVLVLIVSAGTAMGQRGASYDGQAKPWDSTSQGFPGYFDTNVARKGTFVLEFPPMIWGILPVPSISSDYGVTDTLTVGTNALIASFPWLLGAQGGSIKVRSLLVGTSEQQAAVTYYGGGLAFHGETPFSLYYHLMTWNHAWGLGTDHTLAAHANYLKVNLEQGSIQDLKHAELSLSALMFGAGYGYFINSRWSLRLDGVASVYQTIDADTAAISLNQSSSIKNVKSVTLIGMSQIEYHPFPNWLFGVGITGLGIGGSGGGAPWFTWSKRW